MVIKCLTVLSSLVIIFVANTLACSILLENKAISFIFEETFENHTAGTKLPGEFSLLKDPGESINVIHTRSDDSILAAKYIRAKVNDECGCIQFYLLENKSLRDFRNEKWAPSLEYEFQLSCSSGTDETQTFTYMLVIKDENSYRPEFNRSLYEAELVFTKLNGYKIQYNGTNGIRVRDSDFNPKHANITVSCKENVPACSFFDFQVNYITFDKGQGHTFEIEVIPQNFDELNSMDGQVLSVPLVVNDIENTDQQIGSTQFDILVSFLDEPPSGGGGSSSYIPYVVGGGVAFVILVGCSGAVAYLTMRSRKAKDLLRKLTEAEIREFLEGNVSIGAAGGKRSVDVNTPIMALPYNHAFEIQRDKLRIDETSILGTGAFGIVWKGSVVYSNAETITVAVKTVKRNVGILYFKALLSELKIMAYIGKHPNIVSLVGACTHNIRKREVYIAVQYCANGNFHNYLKCRRDRFSNLVVDGNLQLTNSAASSYMYSNRGCFSKSISTMDLLKWATQIANGLQYLESLGVIHGDLATRNVLLDNERVAKIGDFGLSRRLIDYSNYYYTKTSQAPLPWKWMSPESLKDMRFSKKSDIWSFGIVLWEVFTLGQTPYPGLNWDETFLDRLEKGMKPPKPAFAPDVLYEIMVDCWNVDPHDRPAILDIKRSLESTTSSTLRQKGDASYMRFPDEKPILRMIMEDEHGYLEPNDPDRKNYIDA